jgi:hypothetical protein
MFYKQRMLKKTTWTFFDLYSCCLVLVRKGMVIADKKVC